jgi:hypothetical protein
MLLAGPVFFFAGADCGGGRGWRGRLLLSWTGFMRNYAIAVLPGDGIGPDVVAEGLKVLRAVEAKLNGVTFSTVEFAVGAAEYLRSGDTLP